MCRPTTPNAERRAAGPRTRYPAGLRFTHPDYETIDGIEDWQTVWNPSLEQLRDGTARTVMKWVEKDDHSRRMP